MNSIYGTPLSGMQGADFALDTAANNIANLNSSGYESVTAVLQSLPSQEALTDSTNAANASPQNQVGMGVRPGATQRSQEPAPLQATGNPLDLALTGTNYFVVSQPSGQLAYSQQLSLQIEPDGTLATPQGLALSPSLRVPQQVVKVTVDPAGVVTGQAANGQSSQIGSLRTVSFPAPENLQAEGGGLYTETLGSGRPQTAAAGSTQVHAGYQLGSTVDLTTEMTRVIEAQQQFQVNAKALQTLDSLVNTIVTMVQR